MTERSLLPRPIDPSSPAARRLIASLDVYLTALYPAGSNHLDSSDVLSQPHVIFLGVEESGELVACGAVKLSHDASPAYGEIKRMFVLPAARGRGHARRILLALEGELNQRRIGIARLETGVSQPEALQLYRALGYVERGPFTPYRGDPLSVFMEKTLAQIPDR